MVHYSHDKARQTSQAKSKLNIFYQTGASLSDKIRARLENSNQTLMKL